MTRTTRRIDAVITGQTVSAEWNLRNQFRLCSTESAGSLFLWKWVARGRALWRWRVPLKAESGLSSFLCSPLPPTPLPLCISLVSSELSPQSPRNRRPRVRSVHSRLCPTHLAASSVRIINITFRLLQRQFYGLYVKRHVHIIDVILLLVDTGI